VTFHFVCKCGCWSNANSEAQISFVDKTDLFFFIKKATCLGSKWRQKAVSYKNINRGTYSTLKSLDFCNGK